ncbi:MAG: DUF1653 domain-containing protein [Candidatus Paceibacterota bacterium]
MENSIVKIGKYRHYKGKEYQVIGVAKHSETLEDFVVYKALYDNKLSRLWIRPLTMFTAEIKLDDTKIKRFEYIGN